MTNKNLLAYGSRVASVEQDYFAPTAVLPASGLTISTIYAFLAHIDPWGDDANPDQPTQDQQYIKRVQKGIFALKKIGTSNLSPVVPRVDWTSGTVYDAYSDTVDMLELNGAGFLVKNFYVRNSYDQVFKCLWNNNGGASTVMPSFQPGNYSDNGIFNGSDGYKWKYIYTISGGSKRLFFDAAWMPVPVGQNTPGPVFTPQSNGTVIQTGSWAGDIEVINVTNGGSNYQANTPVTVTISGDGVGAAAYAALSNTGTIADIVVTSSGQNYSFANVTISSLAGSGATAIAPVSPVGGHGFDPVSELGANHMMFIGEFNGSENGLLPTDVNYRQVGLLINPTANSTYPNPANAAVYFAGSQFVVSPGTGAFINDETIYQGSTSNPTFTATTLDFNSGNNSVTFINTTGTPTLNAPVFGKTSGTVRILLSYTPTDILLPSGYVAYIENRSAVQRSPSGIEQFKFILGY
jgi:hypothetical protein